MVRMTDGVASLRFSFDDQFAFRISLHMDNDTY